MHRNTLNSLTTKRVTSSFDSEGVLHCENPLFGYAFVFRMFGKDSPKVLEAVETRDQHPGFSTQRTLESQHLQGLVEVGA